MLWIISITFLIWTGVLVASWTFECLPALNDWAAFGDSFGVLTSLITAFALLGVTHAIRMDRARERREHLNREMTFLFDLFQTAITKFDEAEFVKGWKTLQEVIPYHETKDYAAKPLIDLQGGVKKSGYLSHLRTFAAIDAWCEVATHKLLTEFNDSVEFRSFLRTVLRAGLGGVSSSLVNLCVYTVGPKADYRMFYIADLLIHLDLWPLNVEGSWTAHKEEFQTAVMDSRKARRKQGNYPSTD